MLAKLPANQQALLQAADLLELHGHCKWLREDKTGAMCVLGAISKAATGDSGRLDCDEGACATFGKFLGRDAVKWNNSHARTAEEVITALRAAAFHGL